MLKLKIREGHYRRFHLTLILTAFFHPYLVSMTLQQLTANGW